ncbi:MAG: phosphate ABC transporter permease subunit PstC [Tissierellia bacterium]|nr:phosphate ABC transporter permease subunit PstC [Tissierellia bacterium]
MKRVFFINAMISIFVLIMISAFLFKNGLSVFKDISIIDFLTGKDWSPTDVPASYGIFPMIIGSIYVTLGAVIVGVPIGIMTAVYLVFYAKESMYKFLKPIVDLMAGIPSIIYGFFGLMVIVPVIRDVFGGTGHSILTASILLGIMILPTIINLTENALKSVPSTYYQGAVALGVSKEIAIFKVIIPAAKQGILSAIVLGIGRAIGETMAVVMVAGNQPHLPNGVLDGVRTLTTNMIMEMGYASGVHKEALIATGVFLFLFTLLLNIILSVLKRRS